MVTKTIEQMQSSESNECNRRDQLAGWVLQVLSSKSYSPGALPLKPVSSDASFRKYYRIQGPQGSLIAVDAPPETEDNKAFVAIAERWRSGGIRVPVIHAFDFENGFLLLEDFGDDVLLHTLNVETVDDYYHRSLQLIHDIQSLPSEELPEYNEPLLRFELSLYYDWFLQQFLGITLDDEEKANLEALFDVLVNSALEQPAVTVHRDFHSRNLMLLHGVNKAGDKNDELGVIDFQGALKGPVLYDAVSLLKDCYQRWPEENVKAWLLAYSRNAPLLQTVSDAQVFKWFDYMGLQRHLKCLGIFSRLWLRDNRAGYLGDIPETLAYVVETCRMYPELTEYAQWLEQRVMPYLEEQVRVIREKAGL